MGKVTVLLAAFFLSILREVQCQSIEFVDRNLYEGSKCDLADGSQGTCALNCDSLRPGGQQPTMCGFQQEKPIVCCGAAIPQPIRTSSPPSPALLLSAYPALQEACVTYNPVEYIPSDAFVGGLGSKLGEHPYMAALGWTDKKGKIEWNCGGSLIHPRYILTAAHCTHYLDLAPDIVRLGDINLRNDSDDILTVDNNVRRVIVHPDYQKSLNYNDIAILEIENKTVNDIPPKPACLYAGTSFPNNYLLALGYGAVGFSAAKSYTLFQGYLNPIETKDCKSHYGSDENLPNGLIESQICATDPEGKSDTCQGDSGGPLLHQTQLRFYIVGITSFGRFCATSTPGVYTRVLPYLAWIENVIKQ